MQILLDGLWELYQLEDWHESKLSRSDADAYHQRLLDEGRIITVSNGEELVGYVEYIKEHGVCYIQNLYIRSEYRLGKVARMLKRRLFEATKGFRVYTGDRNKFKKRYAEFQLRRSYGS